MCLLFIEILQVLVGRELFAWLMIMLCWKGVPWCLKVCEF
ncbi:hypothetical protein L682_18925 [Aquipseudomonas alcaligenes OT 69]|nr:hypothetical protein L682_18925 [Pseudomonas alcaligenes OT 69]